jgi:hypothetical protein
MYKQENKFKLEISGIEYGWVGLFFGYGNLIKSVSGSGVFNPFSQFDELVCALKKSLKYVLLIDQEGYDFEFKIIEYKNNSVLVSMCNFKDYNSLYKSDNRGIRRIKYLKDIKKERFWINKKVLIKGIIKGLETFKQKEYKRYLNKEKTEFLVNKNKLKNKEDCSGYIPETFWEHLAFYDFSFNLNEVKNLHFFKKDWRKSKFKWRYPLVNN